MMWLAPLADWVVFVFAQRSFGQLGAAHVLSFFCAVTLDYFLILRPGLTRSRRSLHLRLGLHLAAVGLVALAFRGSVLVLLSQRLAWKPVWAMVPTIAITEAITRPGYLLALSSSIWRVGRGARWRSLAVAIITCAIVLRFLYIGEVDLLPEEAYYWNYSQHLDFGYLDHPPMVAWLIWLGTAVFGNTEFGVRIGALCSALVATVFVFRLTRNLFGEASALVAVLLMQVLPFFFLAGLIMTPDAPLCAAWAAALYYLERALVGHSRSAWWGTGISIGIGLLSKYTMGLLVCSALIYAVFDSQSRRSLRDWVPYAAAALALAIFAPVIFWNARHEWASFAFQTSRRLAEPPRFSLDKLAASILVLLTPTGALAIVMTFFKGKQTIECIDNDATRRWRFIQASVGVPLAVFVAFSLRHEAKLDWTGALWTGAVPVLAFGLVSYAEVFRTGMLGKIRSAWTPTVVLLLLTFGALLHYLVLGLPGIAYSSRMENLPVGWKELGRNIGGVVAELRVAEGVTPLVVGMDRYMLASEIAFYGNDQRLGARTTTASNLFGQAGLMYEQWFSPAQQAGRTVLLVAWSAQDLDGPGIRARLTELDDLRQGVVERNGKVVRRYYYRIGHGYLP
jgi:dolichol-phosphate mannosyltransferase